jgi:hypothetical protein
MSRRPAPGAAAEARQPARHAADGARSSAPAAELQRLPSPPVCKECGSFDRISYLAMKGNLHGAPYWLCWRCWSRPTGEDPMAKKSPGRGRIDQGEHPGTDDGGTE